MADMMDLFRCAVEGFKKASRDSSKIGDIETEAVSEAWLGKIYYLGIKDIERASRYLERCVQLRHVLLPTLPKDKSLFDTAGKQLFEVRNLILKKQEEEERAK
jgi:hypothetical protein